jgi:hypothetical protein
VQFLSNCPAKLTVPTFASTNSSANVLGYPASIGLLVPDFAPIVNSISSFVSAAPLAVVSLLVLIGPLSYLSLGKGQLGENARKTLAILMRQPPPDRATAPGSGDPSSSQKP